jgi:hypothetical protein
LQLNREQARCTIGCGSSLCTWHNFSASLHNAFCRFAHAHVFPGCAFLLALMPHTALPQAYLAMGRSWQQLLESYLLLYNYWLVNLKNDNMVFGDSGKSSGNDYFA